MTQRSSYIFSAISLVSLAALGIALVSQHVFDMRPCAWCVLQRLILIVIAVVCGLSALMQRFCPIVANVGAGLSALLGIGGILAAWYQYSVASQMFSCDLTFADRFMTASGLDASLPWIFGIFASCMDAKVTLLGVEYALWGVGLFALITVLSSTVIFRKKRETA